MGDEESTGLGIAGPSSTAYVVRRSKEVDPCLAPLVQVVVACAVTSLLVASTEVASMATDLARRCSFVVA